MTQPLVAVTGSTGSVGGAVARLLADAGVRQRLLVRSPQRAPDLDGAEVRPADYGDRSASAVAMAGVDVLFMVSAPESTHRLDLHRSFIDAAAAAGVRHVVYTSFHAAGPEAVFTLARDHGVTEEYLRASGLGWTFLRDAFYLDLMPHFVGDDGVIRGPAGDGRAALVAREDVARSAVAVLRNPDSHLGRTYDLTGREALTMSEVAGAIAAARGTDVRFHDETIEEAYASRAGYGAPQWQLDAWVSTYTSIARGEQSEISGDVLALTGREPLTLTELLALG
ncbi:SDR family oxidoreductase [Aeromicrobium sp. Leaf350]|uniref:SDR family oxidoreductase n=1 Tax=Aeromicrobium sp. Leaf350 TaxID=2876565 RepID=UPI001E52B076|nr:SDR family oxidoreductase [Aeromicrobium sp. Leaf350]